MHSCRGLVSPFRFLPDAPTVASAGKGEAAPVRAQERSRLWRRRAGCWDAGPSVSPRGRAVVTETRASLLNAKGQAPSKRILVRATRAKPHM